MLLVTYNSNPSKKSDLASSKGWSLYTKDEWATLCQRVEDYFYYLPEGDAELSFGLTSYYSYDEWLADYQVSEVKEYLLGSDEYAVLDHFLGTDFYIPEIATQPDDELVYPEMDAYA